MSNIYDRLKGQLGDDKSDGITALDIADLPEVQQKIMFSLLRDHSTATKGVTQEALQSKLKAPVENIGSVLAELAKNGWLIVMGEETERRYRINLRRKRGASLGFGIWSNVLERLTPKDSPEPPPTK